MSISYEIHSLAALSEHKEALIAQLRQIFFETSARKKFKDQAAKDKFFSDWTSHYIQSFQNELFLAVQENSGRLKVLGYLTGCSKSTEALDVLAPNISSYTLFKDKFDEFPAHFHINFSPEAQGLGLGTQLVNTYKAHLKQNSIPGVHIITAADARNVSFYFRNAFTEQVEREYMGSRLKFMGCRLV